MIAATYQASPTLERALRALAPAHYATPDAPSTWHALRTWYQAWQDRAHAFGDHYIIPVFDGGCDATIYSTPAVNHAFRAWHDSIHLALGAGFDFASELRVARAHVRALRRHGVSREDRRAVWYDTAGQIAYHNAHGEYVTDQRAFVARCFAVGIKQAIRTLC